MSVVLGPWLGRVGKVNKPKWPIDRHPVAPVGKAPDWELNNV